MGRSNGVICRGSKSVAGKFFREKERYFEDLYRETRLENKGNYFETAMILFETPFKTVLNLDRNRTLEAVAAREWFFRSGYSGSVNCLEVLWHLALKISDQSLCTKKYGDPSDSFWELWCNLGLDIYDGLDYEMASEVSYILECWIERRYCKDGRGGCFPLRKPRRKDQRKVELWYQMNEYLAENDVIEG